MTTKLTGWRRIANAIWRAPDDPQIYGALELDATPALALISAARTQGVHLTPTHLAGRALAYALARVPELNVRLIAGRAFPRRSVDVFFITSVGKGHDLTGVKIEDVDHKTAAMVARELEVRATRMKRGDDPDFARVKRSMRRLPRPLLHAAMRATAFWAGDLDLPLRALGVPRSPFGSAMVSSVGMMGIPMGFSPLVWTYRVPLMLVVGEITKKAVVVDDRVVIRPMLPINATIDHRYVDGAELATAMRSFKMYFADPAEHERDLARHVDSAVEGRDAARAMFDPLPAPR